MPTLSKPTVKKAVKKPEEKTQSPKKEVSNKEAPNKTEVANEKVVIASEVKKEDKVIVGVSDQVTKQGNRNNTLVSGERRVGMAKGVTLNMGNYQSARYDVWIERVIPDNDRDYAKAIIEMEKILDEAVKEEAKKLGFDM